jgi:hypothetical protein
MIRNCRLSVLATTILLIAVSNSVLAENYYSSGDLVTNNTISAWFDRSIDVYGVRLLVAGEAGGQPKVPDEWAKKTAQTFKLLMDRDAPGIDRNAQERMIKTLLGEGGWHPGLPTGQRIGYGGGSAYSPSPLSDQGRLSYAGLEAVSDSMSLDDMVWYKNVDSRFTGDDDIAEMMEHILHTLHRFGVRGGVEGSTEALNVEVEESDVTGTELYLAMREAYDNGVFGIEGYGGDIDNQDAWPVMLKEYQYLLTFGMWEYGQEFWENGSLSPEWIDSARTPEGILENNPLGYALFETYFSPVISKPSISALRLIFQDDDQGVSGYQSDSVLTQFLQTTSTSQNITNLHILNSAETAQTFTGTLWDRDGNQLGSGSVNLGSAVPSTGRLILSSADLEALFDAAPWSGPAMLQVQGESSFDLMSKLISPSGLVSNTNCVREDRVLNIEGFDSSNMTYVRLINTENRDTGEIIGTLYDAEGNVVGSANSVLAANLSPHQQVWINRNDLADTVGGQWNGEALLEVNQIAGLKLLNLNYLTEEKTFFNFSCFEDNTSGTVYLQTTSTSQNVSFTHLVNTSDTVQQLTGTLYNKDGSQLGEANQPLHNGTIAAKARKVISSGDIEAAFNVSPWSGPAMLEVRGSDTFALMTKLTSPSGLISNTNCVRQDQVHNIGGYDQTDVTYIRFINTGDTTLTDIRGSLRNAAGDVIGAENPILVESLVPKSQVWRNRDQLSSLVGDTWNGTASLKIENPSGDLRLLNLNYINNETFFNFSCYETRQ